MPNKSNESKYYNSCVGYLNALRDEITKNTQTIDDLIQKPEIMDELLEIQKVEDMCYALIFGEKELEIGIILTDYPTDVQNKIYENLPPIKLCDLLQEDDTLNTYHKFFNENKKEAFKENKLLQDKLKKIIKKTQ